MESEEDDVGGVECERRRTGGVLGRSGSGSAVAGESDVTETGR